MNPSPSSPLHTSGPRPLSSALRPGPGPLDNRTQPTPRGHRDHPNQQSRVCSPPRPLPWNHNRAAARSPPPPSAPRTLAPLTGTPGVVRGGPPGAVSINAIFSMQVSPDPLVLSYLRFSVNMLYFKTKDFPNTLATFCILPFWWWGWGPFPCH